MGVSELAMREQLWNVMAGEVVLIIFLVGLVAFYGVYMLYDHNEKIMKHFGYLLIGWICITVTCLILWARDDIIVTKWKKERDAEYIRYGKMLRDDKICPLSNPNYKY